MKGASLEVFLKLRAMAAERAIDKGGALHGIADSDMKAMLSRLWVRRWAEYRRRAKNKAHRPAIHEKRKATAMMLVRKKR